MNTFIIGKFKAGEVLYTRGVDNLRKQGLPVLEYIQRHCNCDWGNIPDADRRSNNETVKQKYGMLMSNYDISHLNLGQNNLWIITDANRETTIALFPSEY